MCAWCMLLLQHVPLASVCSCMLSADRDVGMCISLPGAVVIEAGEAMPLQMQTSARAACVSQMTGCPQTFFEESMQPTPTSASPAVLDVQRKLSQRCVSAFCAERAAHCDALFSSQDATCSMCKCLLPTECHWVV
jgi:hypothetical protein